MLNEPLLAFLKDILVSNKFSSDSGPRVHLLALTSHVREQCSSVYMVNCIRESVLEKPTILVPTCPTQTGLYKHRKWLEAGNFGFRK